MLNSVHNLNSLNQNSYRLIRAKSFIQNNYDVITFSSAPKKPMGLIEKIMRSKKTHEIFRLAEENAILFRMAYGCILATTLRPLVIMGVPGAKKDDKKYAAVKSIASGLVSLAMAAVLFIPLEHSIRNLGKLALEKGAKTSGFPYKYLSKEYDSFQYIMNMGAGFLAAPLDSYLVFKLVPPVIKKLFPKKEEKKS